MPIVNMVSNDAPEFPSGAYCPIDTQARWGTVVVLHETHHGLCLFEQEENGYHDSDFFMVVWNHEKGAPERIGFATTRGWTYPCLASRPDATDDVLAEYRAWKVADERRQRVLARLRARRLDRELAQEMDLPTYHHARRLRLAYGQHRAVHAFEIKAAPSRYRLGDAVSETFRAVARLLATKRFRSSFRASLAEQVRRWLLEPAQAYQQPLSPKQLQAVLKGF